MTALLYASALSIEGRLEKTGLQLRAGEMVAILGPNGAGKTSLLRALAGIETDGGTVEVAGERLLDSAPARRMRLLAFLPATRGLVWPISVRDVIALGLPAPEPGRVEKLLDLLELGEFAGRPVNSLSTGERSRVLFARALAARPRVVLLDEPLSNLDPYWVIKTLEILKEVAASGSAVLASIHDLSQVESFGRALLVDGGRIVADGDPRHVLGSRELSDAFRIRPDGAGWTISPTGDRRSSP